LSDSLAPADHGQGSALTVSATHPLRHHVPITMMIAATSAQRAVGTPIARKPRHVEVQEAVGGKRIHWN
jgi:hypothetical protein